MTASVVADGGTDVFRDTIDAAEQLFETLLVQRGVLVQGRVQVAHVGLMVLAVVDLHGLGVDVRLERGVVVGQRRQGMLADPFGGCGCSSHRGLLMLSGASSISTRASGCR